MGRAATLRFAAEGASVVFGDLNDDMAQGTLDLAEQAGHEKQVRYIRTDVASEPDVEAMMQLAVSEFERLDVVFNNAGLGGAVGPVADLPVEGWDFTFGVLTRGVFLGIKHGAALIRRHGEGGAIVNTASVAALSGGAGPLAYSAAKAAVVNLTRAAAVELAPERIRVNAICPGGIMTPLVSFGRDPETLAAAFERMQPLPVAGRPEHIAAAALFLACEESAFITGEALVVDGGLEAAGPRLFGSPGPQALLNRIAGQQP